MAHFGHHYPTSPPFLPPWCCQFITLPGGAQINCLDSPGPNTPTDWMLAPGVGTLRVWDLIQTSLVFIGVWTFASAHVLCLPSNSVQRFEVGQTSDFGIKSETSLCRGEHRGVVKLEVQPSESALGLTVETAR